MERSRSLPISPSPSILSHRHIDPDAFPTQQDVTYNLGFVLLGSLMRDQQLLEGEICVPWDTEKENIVDVAATGRGPSNIRLRFENRVCR